MNFLPLLGVRLDDLWDSYSPGHLMESNNPVLQLSQAFVKDVSLSGKLFHPSSQGVWVYVTVVKLSWKPVTFGGNIWGYFPQSSIDWDKQGFKQSIALQYCCAHLQESLGCLTYQLIIWESSSPLSALFRRVGEVILCGARRCKHFPALRSLVVWASVCCLGCGQSVPVWRSPIFLPIRKELPRSGTAQER